MNMERDYYCVRAYEYVAEPREWRIVGGPYKTRAEAENALWIKADVYDLSYGNLRVMTSKQLEHLYISNG